MKPVFRKQLMLALTLPFFAAAVTLPTTDVVHAAKAPRAKARAVVGAIAQASATSLTVDGQEIALNDKTEIGRIDAGVLASDLKVGDTLVLALPGTSGRPTVQSIAPLTLQFDNASITFTNSPKAKFSRYTKIAAADLAAGQQVKVVAVPGADGALSARTVQITGAK
jgi:hypothetical protein